MSDKRSSLLDEMGCLLASSWREHTFSQTACELSLENRNHPCTLFKNKPTLK